MPRARLPHERQAKLRVPPTTRLVLVEGLYVLLRDECWAAVSSAFDER